MMPTSSQARILRREDIDLHKLLRIPCPLPHNRLGAGAGPSQQPLAAAETSFWRPSLSLPQIFKTASPTYSTYTTTFFSGVRPCAIVHNACPRRLPALVSYPSEFQNGAFTRKSVHVFPDISNNWPGDMEPDDAPPAPAGPSSPTAKTSHDRFHHNKERRKSTSEKRKSFSQRRSSSISRRQSGGPSGFAKRRTSISNRQKEETSMSRSDHYEPQKYEVNLLEGNDSESDTDIQEKPDKDDEASPPEPEQTTPEKPKLTIKSLYKQLLSIGMSANAFRGVMVKKEGELKNATEKEAEEALGALVSDIVDVGDEGDDMAEEEEEDVELVMGNLITNMGDKGFVEVADSEQHKNQTSPTILPKMNAKQESGLAAFRKSLDLDINQKAASGPAHAGYLKGLDFASSSPTEGGKIMDSDKDFLQSVAAGAAFQTGGAGKKTTGKADTKTERFVKKKVYKLPPVRLRRFLPPENPYLLCIRTPSVDLTHEQVKSMLEAQLGTIVSLQHDPEYLQNGDVQLAPRAMWIFKMEDILETNYARICMDGLIGYDGEILRIRKRDDVFKEENRAYMLVKQIKDEQATRVKNRSKKTTIKP